jgi:hypothetical protein
MWRIAFPALLILTELATPTHAQPTHAQPTHSQPAFEPLPDLAPPDSIVRDSRTAGRSWRELEASVMRRAAA